MAFDQFTVLKIYTHTINFKYRQWAGISKRSLYSGLMRKIQTTLRIIIIRLEWIFRKDNRIIFTEIYRITTRLQAQIDAQTKYLMNHCVIPTIARSSLEKLSHIRVN